MNFPLPRILSLLIALFLVSTVSTAAPADPAKMKILFIGDSLTFVNDLPHMLAALSVAGKESRPIETDTVTHGGWSLEKLWNDGKAQPKIAAGGWDYVVLQEFSTRPLTDPQAFAAAAQKFDAEIKKAHAQTLLYAVWTLKSHDADAPALQAAYDTVGTQLHAPVIHAGAAWKLARTQNPSLSLYRIDGKHPTPAGTYLTACVFYQFLYHRLPTLPGTLTYNDKKLLTLDDSTALILQQLARTSATTETPTTSP